MKIRSRILILLFILPAFATAGGPAYSRFGIGDLLFYGGSRSYSMGGAALALSGDGFINRINPAGLAGISRTQFSGAFEFVRSSFEDPSGSSSFGRGSFQNIAFAIPISVDAGAVLFGEASPYSMVKYTVERRESQPPVASQQTFWGDGGLSSLSLGTSYRPFDDLSIGAKFNYVYGAIRQITKTDFDDGTFADNQTETSFFHRGSNFTFGIAYHGFTSVPSRKFTVGLLITTPSRMSVKRERLLNTGGISDTTLVERSKTDLPLTLGAGVSYAVSDRILLAADVLSQQWENAEFFGAKSGDIRNSTRIGIGGEILPRRDPSTYFERVAYRAGFAYNASYLRLNGQSVNEWYITGGIGLPLGFESQVDIGFQYGVRGTLASNLIKDTFFKLSISMSATEAWFLTIEED